MNFKWVIVTGGLVAWVAGVMLVMVALGDKVARWAGFADSLPFLGLLALFIAGHLIVTAVIPARSRVSH
jgi:uncharacterized membrane protein YdjX (TVP38/TMEM64 family)